MRSLRIVYEAPLGMPYSLEELLSVLIQCTSLEELLLPIRKDPSSNHPAQRHLIPIVTLPNLHELTLIMDRGTHPGYIVERLSVPELTTLDIRFDTYVDEEDVDQDLTEWPHLLPLLERPHLISELYLRVAMTQANLMQCLPLIPSLEILGFSGINCSDTILQFLTMDHSNPSANVCQKLHTISFTLQGDDEFSSNSMTAMILSRLYGDQFPSASERSPLRVICCDDFDFDNISNNPDIAACMEDGLLLPSTITAWGHTFVAKFDYMVTDEGDNGDNEDDTVDSEMADLFEAIKDSQLSGKLRFLGIHQSYGGGTNAALAKWKIDEEEHPELYRQMAERWNNRPVLPFHDEEWSQSIRRFPLLECLWIDTPYFLYSPPSKQYGRDHAHEEVDSATGWRVDADEIDDYDPGDWQEDMHSLLTL
ncbi:hypothetical protein BD410DRAFT_846966 [Rickenella mellea]|uniref:Uncharacterized protein n=1 Tax=Rickenella mellea TaxID=50990 RepID=A0A4Y7PDT3_9AGAM|nr:hypothetical protein BD410DRAFT_846966 [Rickenella mellea]